MQSQAFWLRCGHGGNERGPGFPRLRLVMGRLARNMRNVDQDFAAWALDFPAGILFTA